MITAPFCSLTHFAPHHYYTGFNRYFYKTELEAKGFKIIEISPNGNYFDYVAQELARVNSMAEKYADRKLTKKENSVLLQALKLVTGLSRQNSNSQELLCFGYHVLAQKI